MSKQIVIPFGPQHPVLPEPIHLDLVLENEVVVDAIPSIGYVHRGLEKLVERREFTEYVYIAERICGICSFIHGMTYCQGVEQVMEIEVPERALYLRTIWSEYSRLHSHLLWLGLFADSFGFENLFMGAWKLREHILDTLGELTTVFLCDNSVRHRLQGVGVLPKKDAFDLGAVGPVARGSGIALDLRKTGYAAYGRLHLDPVTETTGDCYARCAVRCRELFTSIDLVQEAVRQIPEGPVEVKVTGTPEGEYFSRSEQPRGELVHYVKGNGTKHLARSRVRTPTLANIPALVRMLQGCELADVPVIVLSIDPCIGCAER
jgi:ech hydrogenase subunit E